MTKKPETPIANAEQTASSTPAHAKEPIQYSSELATRICDLLATGESIKTICQADGMPHETTVYGWLYRQPEFLKQYRGARIAGCEKIADELFEIVDDTSKDWVKRESSAGKVEVVADHEHISRSRLRFDARRWYLSKLVPKVFGDRVELEVQGEIRMPVDEIGVIERARRVVFVLSLGEKELLQLKFPELSKLLRVEAALKKLGINLLEPFGLPVPEEALPELDGIRRLPMRNENDQTD